MKCRGCGATYDPNLPACPYCGRENTRLLKKQADLERRQKSYEEQRRAVLTRSAGEIRERILTRVMWITVGLTAAVMAVSLVLSVILSRESSGSLPYLDELKDEQRWQAMERYLYANDTLTSEYAPYWQIVQFTSGLEDLRNYRDEYLSLDRAEYAAALSGDPGVSESDTEQRESHLSFLTERMLSDCFDILTAERSYNTRTSKAGRYGELNDETLALAEEACAEARATLKLVFFLDDDEMEDFLEDDYMDSEKASVFAERVRSALAAEEGGAS